MTKIRKSFGVALCRLNKNLQPEIMLVKKKNSYYFFEFILGKYQKNNDKYLMKLFNNMTYREKIEILELNFDNLWYKLWLELPNQNTQNKYFNKTNNWNIKQGNKNKELTCYEKKKLHVYIKNKSKFESAFLHDSGKRLKYLINNSTNAESLWEIPKGRKTQQEKKMDTAIREFEEETSINSSNYSILWHVPPVTESFKDAGITYKNTYYLATANLINGQLWDPKVCFNSYSQTLEIESVKWVSLKEIEFLLLTKISKKRILKLYKSIIALFKKNCKTL